ncbi:MAG: hypothetical protein K2L10_04395 [Ruminococcus sp.]|nr:hypothetical protein [Ruminococcus sp.]
MSRKKQMAEIISQELIETNNLLDILIKKVSKNTEHPQPWLLNSDSDKAKELRSKNPELYDYISQILILYFR